MTNKSHLRTEFISRRQLAAAGANASFSRGQNLTVFRTNSGLGPIANVVIIVLLIAFLGLLYLTQLSKTSTFGYELNKIDAQKSQALAEQNDLKVENARLQSISRVANSAVAAAMTNPDSTDYAE